MSNSMMPPAPWRTTPDAGEWNASIDKNGSSCYQGIKDADGVVIGIAVAHDSGFWGSPDPEPQARLFAASHELLEALKLVAPHIPGIIAMGWLSAEQTDSIRAAIAKAEGQS